MSFFPYSVRFAAAENTVAGNDNIYTCPDGFTLIVQSIQLSANFVLGVMESAVALSPEGSGEALYPIWALTGVTPESQNFTTWEGKCVLTTGDTIVLVNGNGGDYTYIVSGVILRGVNPLI
jgi:hypothetical protein